MKILDKLPQFDYRKNRMLTAVLVSLVFLIMSLVILVSVTFSWMDVSRVPFISDLELSVITENNLVIAPDVDGKPGEWGRFLMADEYMPNYAPLKPVTYMDGEFKKIVYSDEKRTNGFETLKEDNINVIVPAGATDSKDAEKGYLVYIDYWIKTNGATASVSLSQPHTNDDGEISGGTFAIGKPVWSDEIVKHINGAHGAETTLRVGFDIWKSDDEGNIIGDSTFFIYEPNADLHPRTEERKYTATASANGKDASLVPDGRLIVQKASTWSDASPAIENSVIHTVGDFIQNPTLFSLDGNDDDKTNDMVKIRMWLWMEGQDSDCSALTLSTKEATSMLINIDFSATETGGGSNIKRPD